MNIGAVTIVIALLDALTCDGRAPRAALALALAFPAMFVLLFIATVIVFAKLA